MKSFNSFSYQISSLSTEAIQTSTHGARVYGFSRRKWNSASNESQSFICNPLSFTTCWGNPYSNRSSTMNYSKRPLGFKFKNFHISNRFSPNGIDHYQIFMEENKFWLNPNQISEYRKGYAKQKFKNNLHGIFDCEDSVDRKEENQHKRNTCPKVITSRSENSFHPQSISGVAK